MRNPQVAKHLKFPLTFRNNPPSAVRPRHRNRYVSQKIIRDSNGREHMFLHFYVHGSDSVSHKWDEKGYFEALVDWTRDRMLLISQFTLSDSIASTKAHVMQLWERSKNTFRYLTGTPIPVKQEQQRLPAEAHVRMQEKDKSGSWWGVTGLFDSLRRKREKIQKQKEGNYTIYNEGEVQAELVRVRFKPLVLRPALNPVRWIE
jgi:import inner membrane translocase subunit TIM21